jgi:hypothetical protein
MFGWLKKLNASKPLYRVEECNGVFVVSKLGLTDWPDSVVANCSSLEQAKQAIAEHKLSVKKTIVYEEF